MQNRIFKKKSFEWNSLVLFILLMIANAVNYLYQVIVAKLLPTVEQYGVVNSLLALFSILIVPGLVMVMVTARYIATCLPHSSENRLKSIMRRMFKVNLGIAMIMLTLGVLLVPVLANLLQITERGYLYAIMGIASVSLLTACFTGALQGKQEFTKYGLQNLLNTLLKFLAGILLLVLGFEIAGVLISIFLGTLIALIYTGMYALKYFHGKVTEEAFDTRRLYRYIVEMLVLQVSIGLLTNGDVLMVKTYFSETEAGIYASSAVMGKIILYVSGAVVTTMYPLVAAKYEQGENILGILKKSVLYVGGASLLCSALLIFTGKPIILLLFGDRYLESMNYILTVCLYVVLLVILTVLINFLSAMGKTKKTSIVLILGCVVCVWCSRYFHTQINQMLIMTAFAFTILIIYNLIQIIIENKQNLS